jgi:anti-sigma regulatory factor (Ser/Thr protein kinase)
MDWYVDTARPEAITRLRHDLRSYLERHSEPGSDVEAAIVAFSELLTNAALHTRGPAWVSVDWTERSPLLTIHDLGPGFELGSPQLPDPEHEGGRGLFVASHLTSDLQVAHKRAAGAKVSAVLPVTRSSEESFDPPETSVPSLPTPEEASAAGLFGRESFLRALVVQLSQALELEHGPASAERAVAQVGIDVGARIEEEFRRARELVGELSPEQMAELFVALKGAIEGDFYVIEATDERIVLGNRRCPFGDVVKRAPSLCRMTSSVFGGIAARNRGRSAVQLEERIAVGDPGCRVIVCLKDPPQHVTRFAHHYTDAAVR